MLLTHVVVINGPAGVGKTTISGHLANLYPGTINVSGDAVRSFGPLDAKDHLGPRSTYRAGGCLVAEYLAMGARRVLFDYVFETREAIESFCRCLPAMTPVYFFTIWAPLETVVGREAARPGRERLGDRVVQTYGALERNLRGLGSIVENMTSPEEAATAIRDTIKVSEGIHAGSLAQVMPHGV
jgi:chloramphenicol 3-O-phosphotransferase